jgi:hypothetical protein
MSIEIIFRHPNNAAQPTTIWIFLKWTYLVVSSTFDGTYSNIWATNTEFDPSLNLTQNVPIDPIGTAFLAFGGDPGDCDIYVNPLLQLDIDHCLQVPANGQYQGGRPIIHAYITGFSLNYSSGHSDTVSVIKGNDTNIYSDSADW